MPETGVSLTFTWTRASGGRRENPGLKVMGPIRTARVFDPSPGTRMMGVRLKPEWCRDAFGLDPSEHVDGVIPAAPRRWAERLLGRLAGAADAGEVAALLLGAVEERWRAARPGRSARLAHAALERVRAPAALAPGSGDVAREVGVSARHLRRVVVSTSGIGLKRFHRVRRLHRAISLACADPDPSWAAVAVRSGFYDQAHMIGEFRAMTGLTPVGIHRERSSHAPVPSGEGVRALPR